MITEILTCAILGLIIILTYLLKRSFSYWKNKNVPFVEPVFPFGSFLQMVSESEALVVKKAYRDFRKTGAKHGGLYVFNNPVYIPVDPKYIKNVLIKDFQHFMNHQSYFNEKGKRL